MRRPRKDTIAQRARHVEYRAGRAARFKLRCAARRGTVRGMQDAALHRVLPPARIRWHGDQPVSAAFDDIYCDGSGAAEAERVFVAPARLAARCAASGRFAVAELGFGLGLNFAVAAQRAVDAPGARLHYIAFEAAPPSEADFVRAARCSGLALHRSFAAAPPPRISGWHRRRYVDGRVQLSLYYGDVRAGLQELVGRRRQVDAWLLDGFAPPRNMEMWSDETCAVIAGLSRPGATVTTYSAAGSVKRALRNAGFEVSRIDQRPRKRHSLLAVLPGAWRPKRSRAPSVAVVGAGFAGCAVARSLAERGMAVVVRDAARVRGASNIPCAVLHSRLLADGTAAAAWRAHSYAFAAWFYRGLPGVAATGVLQLPGSNASAARLARLRGALPENWLASASPAAAAAIAGIPLRRGGLHFPQAATVCGATLCAALLDHPGIDCVVAPAAPARRPEGEVVVYANGAAVTAAPVAGAAALEVTALAGQADLFHGSLEAPVLGDGYCARGTAGRCWAGATYEYRAWSPGAATAANRGRFERLFEHSPGTALATFRGHRAVTSDRAPIIGLAAPNTYVSAGHGASGLASAALAGEWIARLVCG